MYMIFYLQDACMLNPLLTQLAFSFATTLTSVGSKIPDSSIDKRK